MRSTTPWEPYSSHCNVLKCQIMFYVRLKALFKPNLDILEHWQIKLLDSHRVIDRIRQWDLQLAFGNYSSHIHIAYWGYYMPAEKRRKYDALSIIHIDIIAWQHFDVQLNYCMLGRRHRTTAWNAVMEHWGVWCNHAHLHDTRHQDYRSLYYFDMTRNGFMGSA